MPAYHAQAVSVSGARGLRIRALRSIRQDERFRALPLVVLTTSSNPLEVVYCYAAGANAYQTKPVSYPEHLQTLRAIFEYRLIRVALPDAN